MSIQWMSPSDGSVQTKGEVFEVEFDQNVDTDPPQGVATLQFSNSEGGYFTTCQGLAGGGPLRAEPVPWDARDVGFVVHQAAQYQEVWARGAVFADQGLVGPPVYVSNVVHFPKPLKEGLEMGEGEAPEERPR